jgi:hypothetical protein
MIETSTPVPDSQVNNQVQNEAPSELSEEDQVFLISIKEDLNKITKMPLPTTVEAIIKYSRSL